MTANNSNQDWRNIEDSVVTFGDDGDHTVRPTTNLAHLKALEYARHMYARSLRGDVDLPAHPAPPLMPDLPASTSSSNESV